MTDEGGPQQITFIVRLATDRTGVVTGVVERVKTSEKERFQGLDALVPLIARMTDANSTRRLT